MIQIEVTLQRPNAVPTYKCNLVQRNYLLTKTGMNIVLFSLPFCIMTYDTIDKANAQSWST